MGAREGSTGPCPILRRVSPASLLLLIVVALFVLAVPFFLRANEVCAISVRRGKVMLLRGRAPATLYDDISEVVRRANVASSMIRIVKEGGAARLLATGVDEPTAQRLRNVLGAHPYRLLVSPPPATQKRAARNLGQTLGIASLAWWLADRTDR